jgi:hypothetical protein
VRATLVERLAVTDRAAFSEDQWKALVDAPVAIMLAMTVVGDHGPISMVKESAAGARTIARPPHSGPADLLISQIAPEAEGKEARHDAKQHKGSTPNIVVDGLLADVERAVAALAGIPADESAQVRQWYFDIANAVAAAAKGVKPAERELLDRLAGVLGVNEG